MPQVTVRFKLDTKDADRKFAAFIAGSPKAERDELLVATEEIQAGMQVEGSAPPSPVPWVSTRQKVAFFASKGFGGGIPTTRTGKYVRNWKIESRSSGIGYVLSNRSRGAKYIGGLQSGTGQSSIHEGRWPLFRNVIDAVVASLPAAVAGRLQRFVNKGMKQ